MRRLFFLAIIIAFFTSCEKTEPIPEIFTFTLNGTEMDFSENIKVEKNFLTNEFEISSRKTNVGGLTLTLHEEATGQFDESDYNFNWDDFTLNYSMDYKINDSAKYYYYESNVGSWFKINVKNFENRSQGEVSGEFSGLLIGYILNSDDAVDTVFIESGIFSTKLNAMIN